MGTQTMTIKRVILWAVVIVVFMLVFFSSGCQQKSPRVYKVSYSQSMGVPGEPYPSNQGYPSNQPLPSNQWELQDNMVGPILEKQAMLGARPLNIIEPPKTPQAYHIGPGDVVQLKIFQLLDLNRDEILVQEVDRRGLIYIPLLNYVPVAGLTGDQLREELIRRLGQEFIRDPKVEVKIQRYGSKQVMVLGAVSRPGALALDSDCAPLLDVISKVGGIGNGASPDIEILRGAYQPDRYGSGMFKSVGYDSSQSGMYSSREIVPVSMLFARGEGQLNPM
ncbi:MAG: polysaccharide export protein, partial [Planctomycetes bacterium]|nr:polysaccharide export protein [Planctomycetota bacterium]